MFQGVVMNGYSRRRSTRSELQPLDVYNTHTSLDIEGLLENLRAQHESITSQLESSVVSYNDVLQQVDRIDFARARLDPIVVHVRSLIYDKLSDTASTARQISGAVELLDLEQARVKATLDVVDQVAELKACILGVNGSMGAPQDWETAAEYLHRASKVSKEVVNSGFAEQIVPTAEVPDTPSVTLHNAAQSLCDLFLRDFEKAVQQSDGARITRFFKMFPLIGRSEEGLNAYGKYVCQGVAARARVNLQNSRKSAHSGGTIYVNALTKLFEHVAQVIDGHSNLVERHYGQGTMIRVIERLHAEASVQGGIILDTWSEERDVDKKLTDVKSYAFSFLVQSFLPPQRGGAGTPRPQSPAVGLPTTYRKNERDGGIDMKEIDDLLGEMNTMLGRWSLYTKFITSRTMQPEAVNMSNMDSHPLSAPAFLVNSSLPKKISKLLVEPFNVLAVFFLRRSVEKAFQLDEAPTGLSLNTNKPLQANEPFITSAVDDVMYMVSQIVQRTLATSQASLVVDVISTAARVLGSDFIGMIQRKMRDESYPKAVIQGAPPPEEKVLAFLVLINNLDVAMAYIKRIVRNQMDEHANAKVNGGLSDALDVMFPMNRDAVKVSQVMVSLEHNFDSKASDLINDGISVAFLHVIKPRMRPILAEIFREVEVYIFDDNTSVRGPEDEVDGDEARHSTVRRRFQAGWENLMWPIKRILSDPNFEKLLATSITYLSKTLEKRIWNYHGKFNEIGAVRLERDITDIAAVAVRGGNFRLRESFNRPLQIVMIMNMDDEEWESLESTIQKGEQDAGTSWELDGNERQRARALLKQG